jgi:serine/threonine protein kinase
MPDGGAEVEFSSDPKWTKLREEGAAAGWLLHPDEIERGRELGRGTYGTAYEARWRGVHAVVKCVKVRHADREEEAKQVTSFLREIETLSHLRHPHIMPFFGACMRSYEECWLVTEFLPGGDLSRWLHGDGGWAPKRSVEERLKMAVDVAKGMRAMHESQPPIIHRDLKPSNVFIDGKGNARVADMGLARHLRPGEEAYLTGTTGTYQYMAPEVIDGNAYDQTADVYSFGIMLWEIAVQQKPYEDAYLEAVQVARAVVEDDSFRPSLKKLPKHVPSAIGTLCQRCWSSFTEMRPPFSELVETLEAIEREQGARSSVHHGRSAIAKLWHGGEPVTQAT